MARTRETAGADNKTPSIPQYFSWISNTNEGATERQTIVNLEFFAWLKEAFGMEIKIYAWDAGNFDGASKHYGAQEKEKLKKQYPEGYKNVVAKAAEYGIRMGLWGSPDGYGDDEETEKERFEFFVHLCRDYHFAEFKLDGVCGTLRPEKAGLFAEMLKKCREYSPDLVVLNHRLEYYEADDYITTDLFNGQETYIDILCKNPHPAMHHRAHMFYRGHTDNLNRLMEDHGVCISSCIDYFEDELIYQAFNRSLILAPEIYGNPWLMRDDEFSRLARIYNLHKRNAPILVDGMLLPENMGNNAVSRGDGEKRFIATGNASWETKTISFTLDESIGLGKAENFAVNLHHPTEKALGVFAYGDTVTVDLLPFRAALIEIAVPEKAEIMLAGCEYEIIKEAEDGTPLFVRLYEGQTEVEHICAEKEAVPVYVKNLEKADATAADTAFLYNSAVFPIDNDALEARSLKRAGETKYPAVQAARDAFFGQETWKLRGCEARAMFDGREDSFFSGQGKGYFDTPLVIDGGCLRIDFGRSIKADRLEITCFEPTEDVYEIKPFVCPGDAAYGTDLHLDKKAALLSCEAVEDFIQRVPVFRVHTIFDVKGRLNRLTYKLGGEIRYFALPCPPDRIYSVKLFDGDNEIKTPDAHANNLQSAEFACEDVLTAEFTVPENSEGKKITLAVEGSFGGDDCYAVLEADGNYYGFTDRAPSYRANIWEHIVVRSDCDLTFFCEITKALEGRKARVYLLCKETAKPDNAEIYICDSHK